MADRRELVRQLLDRHGRTYADELGIEVRAQTPSALFRLLCAAVLYSARIGAAIATEAARGVTGRWRTARSLAGSS